MLEEGRFLADRYEILAKIGAGGMSDVYKAKDHVLGRVVAIKVLKSEFADDVNFVTKFRTEAQSAAGLEHPNIVNIYDVGSENGLHYIVMEHVEGITLKTYIEKKGQLSYKETISIAIQVGRGIEAAHHKNIVHRDIKPQNIMISTEGKVKVMDFGIARAATSNTIHSDVMGSVHYTSPEQARNGFVDGKSDIYSLGIVMYEMVTGRVPFDGDTTVAIAIQHLQEEMVSPRTYVPSLPVSLEKIILKCTQKSADRRYTSIEELLQDLRHALSNPDEDFVVMSTPASMQDKTRIISEAEVKKIKEETTGVHYEQPPAAPEKRVSQYEDEEEEEDDGGFLNPKMEKAMTIMGIVAAVIIVVIIIYLVGNLLGIFRFGSSRNRRDAQNQETSLDTDTGTEDTRTETAAESVTMINLRGMDVNEANQKLKEQYPDMNLSIYILGRESSDEYEEGQIITQDITAGDPVTAGTTIKVTVSSGAGEIDVPNVVGNTSAAATDMLKAAGFLVIPSYEYSEEAEGKVIRQSPGAADKAKKGDTITIVISQGRETVQMPDLRNHTEADAKQMLANAGLVDGGASTAYDANVPEGYVISQSETPGNSIYKGTSVTYVVSLGEELKEEQMGQEPEQEQVVLYYLKGATINDPGNDSVIFANIQLLDADGNVLEEWDNVNISSFPFTITQRNITTPTGTIVIEWVLEDEDGNTTSQTQTSPVTFDKQ